MACHTRRVELATLLAFGQGKFTEETFKHMAEQIGWRWFERDDATLTILGVFKGKRGIFQIHISPGIIPVSMATIINSAIGD